ncbi:MAG: hypothetical protein ACKV19_17305 [Verrucomicrobiales bacterium]
MKKPIVMLLGGAAVVASVVVALKLGPRVERDPKEAPSAGAESELEASLKIANPTEDQLHREVELLVDEAMLRNEVSLPEEEPDPKRSVAEILENSAPVERDYDLPALEKDLLATLQSTDADERRSRLSEIAALLAQHQDPEMAKRFMEAILSTRDRFTDSDAYTFATYFADLLSKNAPGLAAEWTENLPERLRYPTQQQVARNWVQQSPAELDAWIQTLGNPGLRASAILMMSQSLGASDPNNYAPEWAKRLAADEDDGSRLSEIVAKHWGAVDFDAAYKWSTSLANADDRQMALLELTKARAQTDGQAAAEWANTALNGETRTRAIQESITQWVEKDPAAVAKWVDSLGEPKVLDNSFDMIAIAWMRKDRANAEAWIESAKVPSERKEYIDSVSSD